MKSLALLALAAPLLSACSTTGLNVSWAATLSYNADVETTAKSAHKTSPVPTAVVPAAPASADSGAK